MNIKVFKHFSFDDTGAFERWASHNGHTLDILDPAEGVRAEWLDGLDLLIILGGPMSVYEEELYPWLIEEKRFVGQAIELEKKILGICLGAQMLADVLGSKVYRHPCKEIGWHPINRSEDRHPWLAGLPERFHSFQWHGDTFELPTGATRLAGSDACSQQAFAYGDRVLGLQFHLETSPACMEVMLDRWADQLTDEPCIQSAERIRAETARSDASLRMLHGILDRIALQSESPIQ
ncbi:type 1 glutamine amidotransferase [Cohnella faecalis]|uniref:Type 1 glutamine amidotransferase n=1 Tax=Cohnella faecalis TaxID=2315694 RepID=A0A398CIE1_9BACL|nr:type 1 glutamine amidotransferase [Cohnella faecalis]RIE02135.1 type 1 glutamine amidotransferase [Cohnella faecalis]